MSSFLAKLKLDEEIYTILKCHYKFDKPIDSTTKPFGEVSGGQITLSIESRGDMNLLRWMLAPDVEKDGEIIFYRRDGMSRLLRIEFFKAYCISFEETFNSVDNEPMFITLTVVARSLKFNHVEFQNDWTM